MLRLVNNELERKWKEVIMVWIRSYSKTYIDIWTKDLQNTKQKWYSTTTISSITLFQNRVLCSHSDQAHPVTGLAYLFLTMNSENIYYSLILIHYNSNSWVKFHFNIMLYSFLLSHDAVKHVNIGRVPFIGGCNQARSTWKYSQLKRHVVTCRLYCEEKSVVIMCS